MRHPGTHYPFNSKSRRGSILVGYTVMLVGLTAIVSLAVDVGHVQVVKTQLQTGADAAARAAASQLISGNGPAQMAAAVTAAVAAAAANSSDNQPVAVLSTDVLVGNYDAAQSPVFSTSRSPANAVQVTVCRQASRGNPVSLAMAPIIGVKTCDVHAVSLARVMPPISPYGIVGINHLNYASLGVLASITGDIASNGDISIGNPLGLLVSVTNDAKSYQGYVSHGGLAHIGGSTSPLSKSLYYPAVQIPTWNNNTLISSYLDSQSNFIAVGLASIPGGIYVVHDLNILADVNLQLQGPVTFYVTGAFNIAAGINLLGNTNPDPANFKVNVANGGTVNFVASILVPLKMNLYAPQSAVNITVGVSSYTGELIAQTLDVNLPILGSFTEVKPTITPQEISLVQ